MLAEWLIWAQVSRGLSQSTIRAYTATLTDAARFLAVSDIQGLGSEDLRSYLHERGGAPATVGCRLAALRSYYGWQVRTGVRSDDPTQPLDRPKIPQGLPRPITDPEAVLSKLKEPFRSIAVFLAETGLRISEALSIRVEPPTPPELIVLGKGNRERIVVLTDAAREALDALGGCIGPSKATIQRRFRAVGVSPHRWRHTLGCALAESGADLGEIQDILGHRSPATTRRYAAYSTDRLRRAHDRRKRG